MKNGKKIGMTLLVIGILVIILYGLYQGFQNISSIDYIIGFGAGLIIIGFLALFISIIMEQQKDKEKMKEEIKKEDLEP